MDRKNCLSYRGIEFIIHNLQKALANKQALLLNDWVVLEIGANMLEAQSPPAAVISNRQHRHKPGTHPVS